MAILRNGNPKNISIHHSAVNPPATNLAELKARASSHNTYHKTKSEGWNNTTPGEFGYKWIRYHYMIAQDGSVLQVQDEKYVLYANGDGTGSTSFNMTAVNIMFEGNYEIATPTDAMMKSAVELIRKIEKKYNIDPMVRGHRQLSTTGTSCPGKNLGTSTSGWIKSLISNVNDTNYPPPPTTPPEPPQQTECQKLVERLEEELRGVSQQCHALKTTNEELTSALKVEKDTVSKIEADLEISNSEYAKLFDEYEVLLKEKNRFEQQYMEAVKELAELKQPHWTEKLRDRLFELWDEYKEAITNFFRRE